MFKRFINLEWKSFIRSASFQTNLALKILMAFGALYMIVVFTGMGIGAYYGLKEMEFEPLETINRFMIYYIILDLVVRYFLQKMPVINIKPLLLMPFNKSKIVKFAFGKTALSFFNIVHAFFFIPFSIVLLIEGYNPLGVLLWHLGIICLIYLNNFLNVMLNDITGVVLSIALVFAGFGALQYFGIFDITAYSLPFFQGFYSTYWMWLIPLVAIVLAVRFSYNYFLKMLYLDAGLASKAQTATTENLEWLDRFGKISVFLKNDIKLIKRNKRSKMTVFMSVLFLFYGLFFFTGMVEVYEGPIWRMFAAVFVTGGFLFSFGQFVPSWDSAYYPLMMTQNIRYKEYLRSKWWLVVIATGISTVLCLPYLYFGWEVGIAIFVGAIFNMGVNAHLVLLGGAYIKTPIDLASAKKAFGDKSAFNVKTLLISLPKMLGPMAVYTIGHFTLGPTFGFILVALTGIAGFAFRNKVFDMIIKIYKTEKYKTLAAYKQKK